METMPAGEGRLVYVMGPSGAGKDAVLSFARAHVDGRRPIVFAHRYATRPPDPRHPNEVALGAGEFALRAARGLFRFDWTAWDVRYGIGTEVGSWEARGLVVVVSGSREHFVTAGHRDPALLPVLVTASLAARERRLHARGREDAAAIAERLRRGEDFAPSHPALVTIANDGPLEEAGAALVRLLCACAPEPTSAGTAGAV
jgi:ribose 1,5-bisphosphokinase